jgi:hypothetical protein
LWKAATNPPQDHDLLTSWSKVAEERGSLGVETLKLVLRETQGTLHRVPKHPQEGEVGHGDEAGQLMMKPASISSERAFCRLAMQMWKVDPRTKMSSR